MYHNSTCIFDIPENMFDFLVCLFFCLARSKNTATEIPGEYFEPASLSCSLNVSKYLRCQIAKKCIHNGTSLFFFFFINIYTQLWGSGSLSDKVQYYHGLWSFLSITRSSGRKACSRGIYLKSGETLKLCAMEESNNVCGCVNEFKMPLRLQEIKSDIAMSPFTLSDMIRLLLHGAFFTFI